VREGNRERGTENESMRIVREKKRVQEKEREREREGE